MTVRAAGGSRKEDSPIFSHLQFPMGIRTQERHTDPEPFMHSRKLEMGPSLAIQPSLCLFSKYFWRIPM